MNLLETDLLIDSANVSNFLPQQAPFIMVDVLIETTELTAVSQFLIKSDNILVNNGIFQESGLIENIAQTIALKAGYEAVLRNEKPQVGFIVQIKDLEIFEYPRIGEIVTTNIKITMNLEQMLVIKGESFSRNKPLITCEMRVFINNQLQS